MASEARFYSTSQLSGALLAAVLVQGGFFALLIASGASRTSLKEAEAPVNRPVPIAVKPVIDDLPLLKLGGQRVRTKLPDMWQKQAPVQRYKASSAPSPQAPKTPETLPTTPLAEPDAPPPPPDAEVAKEVDEPLQDAEQKEAPNVDQEGSADGVKEGTEADPLKARAVSQYKMRILAWFNSRFRPPIGEVDCATLTTLSSAVAAHVDGARRVSGFSITRPSGNAVFDAKVQSTMANIVGQELPPPPPLYPDVLESTVYPIFSGKHPECASQN